MVRLHNEFIITKESLNDNRKDYNNKNIKLTRRRKQDKICFVIKFRLHTYAEMAELADAQASGACGSNIVRVRVPFSALPKSG